MLDGPENRPSLQERYIRYTGDLRRKVTEDVGSERWSWKRARKGAKVGFLVGTGITAAGLTLACKAIAECSPNEIPSLSLQSAWQIGYSAAAGGLIYGFRETAKVWLENWRMTTSVLGKLKPF